MRNFLRSLAVLAALWCSPALADCPYNYPSPWYWSVTDSSPGTQVWPGDGGAFVALADATYVAWVAAGCTATTIATAAGLNAVINGLSLSRVNVGQSWGANAINSAVNVTLTNPLNLAQLVTFTAASKSLTLPQMNLTNSLPIGVPLTIKNVGSNNFTLKDFSGATLYTIHPGEVWTGINYSNATTSGTLQWWLSIDPQNFTNPFWGPQFGGTGANLSATGGTQQFLRQNSSGGAVDVVRPACATLSDSATSCATDATNASNLSSGTVPVARLANGFILLAKANTVNFNSIADTTMTISTPSTRYWLQQVTIGNCSATITTSQWGVFSSTGGAGNQMLAPVAGSVNTSSADTATGIQNVSAINAFSTDATLYFRVSTAQGSAATCDVYFWGRPLP